MKKRICTILCLLTMLGFVLTFVQEKWHPFKLKPLGGVTYETARPELTLKNFASGQFQSNAEQYSRENFGFREWAIRFYNQTSYSLFDQTTNQFVVQGKDGYTFFEESYIISYTGETYLGEEKIQDNTRQIKLIQDLLRTKGITMLPVFVLGKASYYPELIPDNYIAKRHETNNYQAYLKAFEQQSVEMLDFNRYFCERKGTEAHAIYCNLSAHWTVYAASQAMDSLVRYMEDKTQQTQAHFQISGFDTSYLMSQDDDLYQMMNLMFPMKHNTIDQPQFSFTEGYKPKVLTISDSYWWTVWAWNVALPQNLFSDGGFWFYNKTIYPERSPIQNVEAVDYKQEIENQEFVLLVCTEATNHLWPYGFTERYLSAYDNVFRYKQPEQYDAADSLYVTYRNKEITSIIERIKASPEWLESVERQANEKGITVEQSLWDNAEYTYRMDIEPKGFVR
jgi:hypothetical protein